MMISQAATSSASHTATQNACKLCSPLGASLAFAGIEGAVSILHGSQGCATYIRRYMISHFKEPVDIASSNFHESAAIFGGKKNLLEGVKNVDRQYHPSVIGVATTCLAETIGDDVGMYLREMRAESVASDLPPIVHVSTPSYSGTHVDGYHAAIRAMVEQLVDKDAKAKPGTVNILPGILSPADLRHVRELVEAFGLHPIILPDYSDPLDGPAWDSYHVIPEGGTSIDEIRTMGDADATIEMAVTVPERQSGGAVLAGTHGVKRYRLPMPIGVLATDEFIDALSEISGRPIPERISQERGRLIDSFVDAQKHLYGKRAVVFGEEDFVVGIASFLSEIGVTPVLCASGGKSGGLRQAIEDAAPDLADEITVLDGADFTEIEAAAEQVDADLIVGNSKGYKMAKRMGVPLIRIGFPIHDRIGGARVLHVGYRGAQALFDRIANALIEVKQEASPVGYTYM